MILADHARERNLNERHRLWPFIEDPGQPNSASPDPDAVNRISRPVRSVSSATGKASARPRGRTNDCPAP